MSTGLGMGKGLLSPFLLSSRVTRGVYQRRLSHRYGRTTSTQDHGGLAWTLRIRGESMSATPGKDLTKTKKENT